MAYGGEMTIAPVDIQYVNCILLQNMQHLWHGAVQWDCSG